MPGYYHDHVSESRQPQPPYLRIAGIIREQIEHGEYVPGDQIPSMAKISEEHGVSRGTARRVLLQLKEWDLIEVTPGWGSFVKAKG
jgi:DNA-binding GntR family transcriptional regulator